MTASTTALALIVPSTLRTWPDAVRTGLPSSDSTRQCRSGFLPLFFLAQTTLAAVNTSAQPAALEAKMPSYTHSLI